MVQQNVQKKAVISQAAFNSVPVTSVYGDVSLEHQSQFSLGKAHLTGRINSVGAETQVNLLPHSEWTLNNNSVVGNLFLAPNSQITLNSLYDEMNSTYKDG